MKRTIVGFFFLAMGLGMGMIWAGPSDVIEQVGNGEINWSQGIILAKGSGAPPKEAKNIAQARLMAERAALADARRNLLEILRGVQVDSVTTVENYMAKSDQIRLSAEGFIQGSVELKEFRRYLADGATEVTVAMNLSGDFLLLLLRPPREGMVGIPPAAEKPPVPEPPPAPEKKGVPFLEKPRPRVDEKPASEPKPSPPPLELPKFTGLVVDARGLNLQAALIPKILSEEGQELYQGQYVPREKAAQNGLALYSRDLTAAQTNPRIGKNPLTVKGSKVPPNRPSDIMLSVEETKRVAPFSQKGTFLEECRVMIVLD